MAGLSAPEESLVDAACRGKVLMDRLETKSLLMFCSVDKMGPRCDSRLLCKWC